MSRGVRLADADGRAQTPELRADGVPHRVQLLAERTPWGVELETGLINKTP